jgi:hypothetical protein
MTPPPNSSGALLAAPVLALGLSALLGLFLLLWLGWPLAGWVAAAAFLPMLGLFGFTAFVSSFGSTQGVVSSAAMLACLGGLAASAVAAVLCLAGARSWAAPGFCAACLGLALAYAGGAWRAFAQLVAQGATGPWVRASVDLQRGWVSDRTLLTRMPVAAWLSPWMVGALAVQVPTVWKLAGYPEAQLVALAGAAMFAAALWSMASIAGPLLGRALFLIQLEQQAGVRLVHPDLAHVQALRRALLPWRRAGELAQGEAGAQARTARSSTRR